MEKVEKITHEELLLLIDTLEAIKRRFWKFVGYGSLIVGIPFFVPMSILSLFNRRASRYSGESEFLFVELGPENVTYFVFIPLIIIFILSYLFLFRIPKLKKDIDEEEKIVGTIKVREVKKMSKQEIKDFMGTCDHTLVFERNNFEEKEIMFLSFANPEYLTAKEFSVEVSKNAKIPLKKEVISN